MLPALVQNWSPSVVGINKADGSILGGGFYVPGGILTVKHNVGSLKTHCDITLSDGSVQNVKVSYRSADSDMAFLEGVGKVVEMNSSVTQGEDVFTIAHPYGYGWSVMRGIVSSINREIEMPTGELLNRVFQTDIAVNPGCSGCPVFNAQGQVVGMVVAMRDWAENIGFVIRTDVLQEFLAT